MKGLFPGTSARRAQRGHAMVLVALLTLFAMSFWYMSARATVDAVRLERFLALQEARDVAVLQPLARAIALLRTGEPPAADYACLFSFPTGHGKTFRHVTATYRLDPTRPNVWEVAVHPSTDEELASLPPAPATFQDGPSASWNWIDPPAGQTGPRLR